MPEIQLYDSEEDKLYSFPVSQEHFDAIIAGDLTLASKLLEKEKEKNNFVAAYNVMKESTKQQDREQDLSVPSTSGLSLRLNNKSKNPNTMGTEALTPGIQNDAETDAQPGTLENNKLWTGEATTLLISLYKKYDNDFETGIKKYVWNKIAKEISLKCKQAYSPQQCDTKFKGLKNMYKQIKKHNEQSGNSLKTWDYYNLMDEILFSKPEINARATCSSEEGLVVNSKPSLQTNINIINTSPSVSGYDLEGVSSTDSQSTPSYSSSFIRKRRHYENVAERRHKEKLQRQDRYLDILERLTNAIEKKN